MPSFKRICPICGSHEIVIRDDNFFCVSCDTYFENPFKNNRKITEEEIKKLTAFERAEEYLRLSPPRFIEAEERFDQLIHDYPDVSQAFWGKIRAKYGIKYEFDINGKAIPICYLDKYFDVAKDPLFKKCIDLAPSTDVAEKYINESNRINVTMHEWEKKASKSSYDVFLSFKASDEEGNETKDCKVMRELYTYLTGKGLKVFYSPVSMREHTGQPYYDAYIFNALEKSKVLIVYGSKPEYFSSTWIENEWSRYLGKINRKEKKENSLIVVYKGFNPSIELPSKLSKRQNYDGSSYTFFPDMLKLIADILELSTKKTKRNKELLKHINIEPTEEKVVATKSTLEEIEDVVITKKVDNTSQLKPVRQKAKRVNNKALESKLTDALRYLSKEKYRKAALLFNEIINADPHYGLAYIGLASCKFNDSSIYFEIVDSVGEAGKIKLQLAEAISKDLKTFEKAIDYAPNDDIAEYILKYLKYVLRRLLTSTTSSYDYSKCIYDIYCFINSYDSNVRFETRDMIVDNIDDFINFKCRFNEEIFDEVLSTYTSKESNLASEVYEKIIYRLLKRSDVNTAKIYNKKKLIFNPDDEASAKRSVYLKLNIGNANDLKKALIYRPSKAKVIVKYIEKEGKNLTKKALLAIFSYLETEICELLDNKQKEANKAGNILFDYIVKFKYPNRERFIARVINYHLTDLVSRKRFKNVKSVFDAAKKCDHDLAVNYVTNIATTLRSYQYFRKAKTGLKQFEKIYPNDGWIAYQTLLCDMEYDSLNKAHINANSFKQKQFEFILQHSTSKERTLEVNELQSIFDEAISEVQGKFKYTAVADAYDIFLMYVEYNSEDLIKIATNIAYNSLRCGEFSYALKYGLVIDNKDPNNIDSKVIFLLYVTKCHSLDDLPYSFKFNENLMEYQELLKACERDSRLYYKFSQLASKRISNGRFITKTLGKIKSSKKRADTKVRSSQDNREYRRRNNHFVFPKLNFNLNILLNILRVVGWSLIFLGIIALVVGLFVAGFVLIASILVGPAIFVIIVLAAILFCIYS